MKSADKTTPSCDSKARDTMQHCKFSTIMNTALCRLQAACNLFKYFNEDQRLQEGW